MSDLFNRQSLSVWQSTVPLGMKTLRLHSHLIWWEHLMPPSKKTKKVKTQEEAIETSTTHIPVICLPWKAFLRLTGSHCLPGVFCFYLLPHSGLW